MRLRAAEAAGRDVFVTKSREMENLIAAPVLIRWMKEVNWSGAPDIEPTFTRTDYKDVGLGAFLHAKGDECWAPGKRTRIIADGGTVLGKPRFAREICGLTETYADLSEEARTLVEKLAEFIKASNPR